MANELPLKQVKPREKIAPAKRGRPPATKVVNTVAELSSKAQETLREMLVGGATFEDAADAVSDLGEGTIAVHAVEKHFRSDLNLQTDRIRRQLETARKLKQALRDPQSGYAELAEAVLITGLMGLRRRDEISGLQRAIRVKDQQENQHLKKETHRLRKKQFEMDNKVLDVRLRSEIAKHELLQTKILQLKQAVEREGQDHALGPETIQRIQEIYGLVSSSAVAQSPEGQV
ncbi:MAG: hypothetical protein ACRD1O_03405 [Terriglobia bacterium]